MGLLLVALAEQNTGARKRQLLAQSRQSLRMTTMSAFRGKADVDHTSTPGPLLTHICRSRLLRSAFADDDEGRPVGGMGLLRLALVDQRQHRPARRLGAADDDLASERIIQVLRSKLDHPVSKHPIAQNRREQPVRGPERPSPRSTSNVNLPIAHAMAGRTVSTVRRDLAMPGFPELDGQRISF